MKVNIKRLCEEATIPRYAKPGDAGMDIYSVGPSYEDDYGNEVFHTGISMEIPEGYVGLIFPRSSISKTTHALRNHVGVIDSGYRGEIVFKFSKEHAGRRYEAGDRVGQIIILPYPRVEFCEAESLAKSERGLGGFGSTGQ